MRPGDASTAFVRCAILALLAGSFASLRADAPPLLAAPAADTGASTPDADNRPPAPADRLAFHFAPPAGDAPTMSVAPAEATELAVIPGVVRLPDFHVRDRRIDLDEREVLSAKGLIDDAKHRYLSPVYRKTFGPISQLALIYFNPLALLGGWHPNDAEAMALYEQEERLRRMRRTDGLLDLYEIDDAKAAIKLKGILYDTYRHEQAPSTRGHHDQ